MKLFLPLVFLLFVLPAVAQSVATNPSECVRVTAEFATLRGKPAITGKALDVIEKTTQLEALMTRDAWTLVQGADYVGWVEGKTIGPCVTDTPAKTAAATTTSKPVGSTAPPLSTTPPKTVDGRTYTRGPKGGCYYINPSGKKTYVDHSFCP